jgi:hypothetical protein
VARGWESKSIQSQIESANASHGVRRVRLSPEQVETERKLDSLLLHRKRVLHDIEGCSNLRYKKTLEDGLAYLEGQLVELGWRA